MNIESTCPPAYDLKAAKRKAVELFLRPHGNVVGVGIGKKVIDGRQTPIDCVRVYVIAKKGEGSLPVKSLVPEYILGVPTDVIEVSRFGRKGHRPKPAGHNETRPGSPIRVQTDAVNVNEGARGTLGALVTDGRQQYLLSCNHILRVNGRVPPDPRAAQILSAVFVGDQPHIAEPGPLIRLQRGCGNPVDCAIAPLKDGAEVVSAFPVGTFVLISGDAVPPAPEMRVQKVGAATGHTHGVIVDTDADLYVDFSFGTFLFEDQVIIEGSREGEDFANDGDSGSIVATETEEQTGRATAMIFAASGRFAVACPLPTVLEKLGAELSRPLSLVV